MSSETKSPEVIQKAHDMVSALCDGRRDWIMSIPARPDTDPDLVIGTALSVADNLYAAAEFDSRLNALMDFDNEAFQNRSSWDSYYEAKWAKAEELFPAIAAQYPTPTEAEAFEWRGEMDSPISVRESMHWEDFTEVLHSTKDALRDAALAKARGGGAR